jgi:magnesium chelatase subunit D
LLNCDLRVKTFKHRATSTTIFAVDASGSAALTRMGEAKGAVELLLGECYVRRDRVGLVAFRGKTAETLLAPTRSLARAKRALVELPGGGTTPLASGIEAAHRLSVTARRAGDTVLLVLLTDGQANVDLQGRADRKAANAEALVAACRVREDRLPAVLIDISPRHSAKAAAVARELDARYVALPHADARRIYDTVRTSGRQ